jgi:hypothetical protein
MARADRQASPGLCAGEDLVDTVGAQRPASSWAFEHDEQLIGARVGRPLVLEVGGDSGENCADTGTTR